VTVAECGLHIGDPAGLRKPLDRLDRTAIHLHGERQAGTNDLAANTHRARAADAMLAADMGASQLQMLAQKIREIEPRQHLRLDAFTIDREQDRDLSRHALPPKWRSGRCSSEATHRPSSTFAKCRRIA